MSPTVPAPHQPEASAGAPLMLFNSMSRALEALEPIDPAMVRLYSCGPTVYNFAHLGNLRAYVFTDTLRRTLNWKGWATTHVINITDVGHLTSDADAGEDKMEAAAQAQSRSIWDIAAFYTNAFQADLAALGILKPSLWATATDHVQDMIAFARVLEARGSTYELNGGLYFDTSTIPDYGLLAGQRGNELIGRIADVEGKRHPADFAVWRASPPDADRQMEWDSPWGRGAPGWHLECSVMSLKYLGAQFDIHTGGIDHREIHHCNEIAQNQSYNASCKSGANIWMHNNFLVDRDGKMSKSKGGFATLPGLVERGVPPLAYRLLCLSAHYRSELEFSAEALSSSLIRLKRLVMTIGQLKNKAGPLPWIALIQEMKASRGASFAFQRARIEDGLSARARAAVSAFDAAVSADLMTPQALPLLEEALATKALDPAERLRIAASFDLVLGLNLLHADRRSLSPRPHAARLTDEEVEVRLDERRQARQKQDYGKSDMLRDELISEGVDIMDGDPLRWEWRARL